MIVHDVTFHDSSFADLTAEQFHRILRLRIDVFVVEQSCVYHELDGRDIEVETRHLWFEVDSGTIGCYLRILDDGAARRIGRVVTDPSSRGQGLAAMLVDKAVDLTPGPWVLDAQSHLAYWYVRRGFGLAGEEFVEDGIPHVPMRREPPARQSIDVLSSS